MSVHDSELAERILKGKQEKGIYIIAHYYQRDEIQDIADFIGDSYAMAVNARNSDSQTILVAGVDFMAESAAILCPGKTILSPEPAATCPMANSIRAEDISEFKKEHPDGLVVSYVNTPAEVKAYSDVCCTSSNAGKILGQLPENKPIFFIPDQNLACNVSNNLGRRVTAFPSSCPIHAALTVEDIMKKKQEHPEAALLVHPECDPAVVELADYVGSTAGILNYTRNSPLQEFIIATESGISHAMRQARPEVRLIMASDELICPNMKSITLEKILYSIENLQTVVTVPEDISKKAIVALEKMIELAEQRN